MTISFELRCAVPADALSMARVHVGTWRETYRELMSDGVLDDPVLLDSREKFWHAMLTDSHFEQNRVVVASRRGALIGIAMAGPCLEDGEGISQLYVLYVYAAFHGAGVGAALLNAVIAPGAPAALWVADPNPRAQAFYRKNGFVADGAVKIEDDVREVRIVVPTVRSMYAPSGTRIGGAGQHSTHQYRLKNATPSAGLQRIPGRQHMEPAGGVCVFV
ncbi:GNAT family N-acetyltransferase [Arthrobacter sp. OAP107]|uniref:GNAT family N-acetyltransferase n=1 Tax=Arthrobacter sp. OAP107 TaxID=3156445 RepID=UPI0033977466